MKDGNTLIIMQKRCVHQFLRYQGEIPNTGSVICRTCHKIFPNMNVAEREKQDRLGSLSLSYKSSITSENKQRFNFIRFSRILKNGTKKIENFFENYYAVKLTQDVLDEIGLIIAEIIKESRDEDFEI
jgi:two-component sensor histidine kinase